MTKRLLLILMVAVAVMLPATALLGAGLSSPPAPGWQCMPYAGVAEFTLDNCTDHAPVFVYLGNGTTVLAYAIFTAPSGSAPGTCFPQNHSGWSPVELGAQPVSGVGAITLRGEDISVDFYPGAPSDQSCLDSLRVPWPNVRVTYTRIDELYVLMSMEAMPPELKGKPAKKLVDKVK